MYFLRAGLFAITITIALCIALTSGVPLPTTKSLSNIHDSSLQATGANHYLGEHARHVSKHGQRIFSIKSKHVSQSTGEGVTSQETIAVERRSIFSKIKKAFKKIGHGIKHAFQKVGHGIKKAAQKIGKGIKKVAKKVGSGIKKVAKKVGSGIKKGMNCRDEMPAYTAN